MANHYKIVIIGGGTAGIITAAQLTRAGERDIAIIEPSDTHYYQPLWTLVGGGVFSKEVTARAESDYIPRGVNWLKEAATEIDPQTQQVTTASGQRIGYDFLVVATGVELNLDGIPGLRDALATPSVSTNYSYNFAPKTWEMIRNFRGGTALFHMPNTPIKCPGAPQKIMYLAADYFRNHGVQASVVYGSAIPAIYGIKEYAAVLQPVVKRYGIDARYCHRLVEIDPARREAIFEIAFNSTPNASVCSGDLAAAPKKRISIGYDMFHVIPPQRPPAFIRESALADAGGWIDVHPGTMRSVKYPNVFALGDVANSPNAKTGAAAFKQAPVVTANLLSVMRGAEASAEYDGYVACPIVTSYGKMVLCEFDYTKKPTPTMPFIDTCQERYDMWLLKKHALPWTYWNVALRGKTVPFLKAVRPPVGMAPASVSAH